MKCVRASLKKQRRGVGVISKGQPKIYFVGGVCRGNKIGGNFSHDRTNNRTAVYLANDWVSRNVVNVKKLLRDVTFNFSVAIKMAEAHEVLVVFLDNWPVLSRSDAGTL